MERNNLDELLCVLETIRSEKYPGIPEEVIRDIVYAQYENQADNDRVRGRTKTTQTIVQFLNQAVEGGRR